MTKNQCHEWHERLEDGRKQYIRAHWNSREWIFRLAHPDGEEWMPMQAKVDTWLALRDVLFRKYQRKRLPLKHLLTVDSKLEALGWRFDGEGHAIEIDGEKD